ncbi:MAG TPA: hypothetical protein VER33_01895, partial [Polyangiaceae bacterium]|nr:hypothetical protein [Polyangiaceae bacterium]
APTDPPAPPAPEAPAAIVEPLPDAPALEPPIPAVIATLPAPEPLDPACAAPPIPSPTAFGPELQQRPKAAAKRDTSRWIRRIVVARFLDALSAAAPAGWFSSRHAESLRV